MIPSLLETIPKFQILAFSITYAPFGLPKLVKLEINIPFNIRVFQGKPDLLKRLPERLKAYKAPIYENYKIIVIVDRDNQDCRALKNQLEDIAQKEGILTKSSAKVDYRIINRIAIEELESWFFGDVQAINAAYQKIPLRIINKERYRDPDAIKGGTAEALEKILKDKKYYTRMPKPEVARKISFHMEPERNTSKSFQVFRDALKDLEK